MERFDEAICPSREMTEVLALGRQVVGGMSAPRNICAHPFYNFNSRREHSTDLLRIVSHQSERTNLEESQDIYSEDIIAQVGHMPHSKVCFDRIEASFLEFISAQLFHQSDTSTLLMLVDENS